MSGAVRCGRAAVVLAALLLTALPACGSRGACPPDSVERNVCTQCGAAGGCARTELSCAPVCSSTADCPQGRACSGGACVPPPCF